MADTRTTILGLATGAVVLAGVGVVLYRGSASSQAITAGTGGVADLINRVLPNYAQRTGKSESGLGWLLAFGGLFLVLVIVADAGAGDLASALAWVIAVTALGVTLTNGSLTSSVSDLLNKSDQGQPGGSSGGSW